MTHSEAIDIISSCAYCPKFDKDYCCTAEDKDCYNAKQMAIKALEKQIAMKPFIKEPCPNLIVTFCPICDGLVFLDTHPFCNGCGQRIDWDDYKKA